MSVDSGLTRRQLLRGCGGLALAPTLAALTACKSRTSTTPAAVDRNQMLDEMQRAIFDFFWTEASHETGQVKDRALVNGNDTRTTASIAATGFGLSALCIGHDRDYRSQTEIKERVRKTLSFTAKKLPHEHGFFYHFIDMNTGERIGKCELSSIDSSLFYCGILTARQYFSDPEIEDLATKIYERVDWPWMLNGGPSFSMGWRPQELPASSTDDGVTIAS